MIEEAKKAILASSQSSSIYIGADSIRYKKDGKWFAKYSTVIVLHMDSKHGCKLWHNSVDLPDYGNLKQRLLTEVGYAIEVATQIIEVIGDRHLEVHIDVNHLLQSRKPWVMLRVHLVSMLFQSQTVGLLLMLLTIW